MSIQSGYLTTLFSGMQSEDTSLVRTLYGFAGAGPKSGAASVNALRQAERNRDRDVRLVAAEPAVKLATDRFIKGVQTATSVTQLLKNPAVMEVLLTANGLADRISASALARRALTSDLTDPKSLANTLTDTRWKSVAKTYDFAASGLAVIQQPEVMAKLADAYAEVKWRQSLNEKTPGLSNALTFRTQASKVTSVYQILGDPVLRDVVTTAYNIPKQIAFQSIDAQERAISKRLDITKLQDAKFVETIAQRYLLNTAANTSAATPDTLVTLATKARGLVI
ncbi:MAG: DUF1217 domain-containing protein [Acetobacteraceae bacterium]